MTKISDKTPQGLAEDQRLRILQWLSPIDHRERHLTVQKQRLDGTGRWFLDSDEFKDWKTSSKPSLLWLTGSAGTGKTFLT
jgi:ankyrin repeat domain-containing protein 50